MNWSVLRNLLERYYNGTSSAEDEAKLRSLLDHPELPEEFQDDSIMISGLLKEDPVPESSDDLDMRIMNAIDSYEKEKRILSGKRRIYAVISAAATVLIVMTFWFVVGNNAGLKDSFNDPELAYNETVKILYTVSENLNKGMGQMSELSTLSDTKQRLNLIPESGNTVSEELRPLKYLSKSLDLLNISE